MSVTIRDIANATRHSTATIDRVLNNRPGVSQATRQAILKVAAELNYGRAVRQNLGLDFILPTVGAYKSHLGGLLVKYAQGTGMGRPVRIHYVDYNAPETLVALLESLHDKCAGIGLVALDHILIRDALRVLITKNIPVITLLTDISSLPHQGYIGPDNRLSGRLAGHLIGRFLPDMPGKVALFIGSHAYRGHEEREMGFRSIIRENFPHLQILDAVEVFEDDDRGYAAAKNLLMSVPDLSAIYNTGSGTAGIVRAFQDLALPVKPVFVAHDLSPETRPCLLSGQLDVLIDQNVERTAYRAIERLQAAITHQMLGVCEPMEPRIIFKENLPPT